MAGALPVLGFREWQLRSGLLVSSVRGEPWPASVMVATCSEGHTAPADGCTCGVYAIDSWPRLGDDRLYEQATAPMRWFTQGVLTVLLLGALGVVALVDRSLLAEGRWGMALVITAALLLAVASIGWADCVLSRSGYVLGAVVLTGRVLHYRNGVLRAERARIGCLIRPPGVSRREARRAADRIGVPLFDWRDRPRVLTYLSEHGDLWDRARRIRAEGEPPACALGP